MITVSTFSLRAPASQDESRGLVADEILAAALAFTFFFQVVEARLHGSLTPLIAILFGVWVNGVIMFQRPGTSARKLVALGLSYVLFMLVLVRLLHRLDGSSYASTVERVFLLLPLAGAAGWYIIRTRRTDVYFSWLAMGALVSAPLAIIEYAAGVTLLHTDHETFVRNGQTRAVVGAEHPLVLGALFVAVIPIILYLLPDLWLRYPFALLCYAGAWMTGSNGPEIVGGVLLVVCLVPPVASFVLATRPPLLIVLIGLTGFLIIGAYWFWTPQIHGTNTTAVSNEYRGALYNLALSLLRHHPFGFGFGGLPPDTYLFFTTKGTVDVADSVDSEFVYAITQFGWLAVIVFAAVAVVGALTAVQHNAVGLSLLSVTLVGLFLAIHSWNSLGCFWALMTGMSLAILLRDDAALRWCGLAGRERRSGSTQENRRVTPSRSGVLRPAQ